MTSIINQTSFLKVQREFPDDPKQLTVEVDKAYVDVANAVNTRTIGLYPTNRPAIVGDSYYYNQNRRQQALRQLYRFVAPLSASYPHGINPKSIDHFSPNTYGECKFYDSVTNTTNYYGAIFASDTPIAGQYSFWIDGTTNSIVIEQGAGVPTITEILIVLEWISTI